MPPGGVHRDSEMVGEPMNYDPACFWRADLETVAEQLAAILREESGLPIGPYARVILKWT